MKDLDLSVKALYNIIYNDKKAKDEINRLDASVDKLGFVTKIIYGVLENKIYLDYMIEKLSSIKLSKVHREILIILEIGIYNIHFLNTKDYAIVNQLVEISKKRNKKSSGFVNAILRNFIRNEEEIAKIRESDDIKSLSIRYSLPEEITRYIFENYGLDYTKKYLRSASLEQDLSIRVNYLKTTKEDLKKSLEMKGYDLSDGLLSDRSLIVRNPASLAKTEEFKDGLFTIQQESSMMAVEAINPGPYKNILDLCAAPGTKTGYLAEISQNKSRIVANDISKAKLDLISENIERLGLANIELTNFDASKFQSQYEGKFDYCLVDAPCSGLGVLGRKPEIRYNRSMDDIVSLADLQRKILDNAISYLKPGAILVFSTCTIGRLENQDNYTYLSEKSNLRPLEIGGKAYLEYNNFEDRTDGFFISKFKRI